MSNWYEYMSEAELAAHMADEPQEAMVAKQPEPQQFRADDGTPLLQLNETVWQTQGKASFDLMLAKGHGAERRLATVLNLPEGKYECKDIGISHWDRANLCIEYQQYSHSLETWVDSGIRTAATAGVEVWNTSWGLINMQVPVSYLSDIVELAVAGHIDDPAVHVFIAPLSWQTPTKLVNVDIKWLLTNYQLLMTTGECAWQSPSTLPLGQ